MLHRISSREERDDEYRSKETQAASKIYLEPAWEAIQAFLETFWQKRASFFVIRFPPLFDKTPALF